MTEQTSRARLLHAAARLFAELGYDQTTSTLIAGAAGVPVEEIASEFGGRRALYLAVYQEAQSHDLQLVSDHMRPGFTRDDYHRLIDDYIDSIEGSPYLAALWIQRWMNDATDIRDVEQSYAKPQTERLIPALAAIARDGVDAELTLLTLVWTIQMHTVAGSPLGTPGGGPRERARFRAHVHTLVDALFV
ncbi:TetR family transcriptional regulator [Actinocorallia herbida]|uniref:TetR family transcriptional regulator n=1 Tax=Actinocorallia herbida TaxID=58109 RepID=A0A3N1D500_9ACTN|nr:TetR/AcrR family transcriptional regulator [Actinocorallia herbida]ROO88625.1 TetR family transcriptional regulator [Actinocorallia herbida]